MGKKIYAINNPTVRCDCCYDVAGPTPEWTKTHGLGFWLCDGCFEYLKDVGYGVEERDCEDREIMEQRAVVVATMETIPDITSKRVAHTVMYGPHNDAELTDEQRYLMEKYCV